MPASQLWTVRRLTPRVAAISVQVSLLCAWTRRSESATDGCSAMTDSVNPALVIDRPATTNSVCWNLAVYVVDVDGLVNSFEKGAAMDNFDFGRAVRADIVMVNWFYSPGESR